MDKKNAADYNFESIDLIRFMFKHKWKILIITSIAIIASVIVSLNITPKFKSSVILFPKTQVSISNALTNSELINTDNHIMNFGDEDATEQLLQALYSEDIRLTIIEKFDLLNHYKIDKNGSYPMTKLHSEYNNNIKYKRTQYMAVEINVMDTDAKMAADIANEIASLLDSTLNKMQNDVAKKILIVVQTEYINLNKEISSLKDSLRTIQSYGITNYTTQAESLNKAYINALKNGNSTQTQIIQKKINILEKYGADYLTTTELIKKETERLSLLKGKLAEAEVNANQKLPHKFMVAKAYAAEKKSYPVRWLIVAISTIVTFVFSILLLLFIDRYKDLLKF